MAGEKKQKMRRFAYEALRNCAEYALRYNGEASLLPGCGDSASAAVARDAHLGLWGWLRGRGEEALESVAEELDAVVDSVRGRSLGMQRAGAADADRLTDL